MGFAENPPSDSDWLAQITQLPVGAYLSPASLEAVKRCLQAGPASQRGYRLVQFFQAIDWLLPTQIHNNPLKFFNEADQWVILKDIQAYYMDKQAKRQAQRAKREDYRKRVFEYYRQQIPAEDKILLEQLRDYELDRIGRDVNWRHYFWFNSFKQIDAFLQESAEARQQRIYRFMMDVEMHYKNVQRMWEGTYADYYWGGGENSRRAETFEEWAAQNDQRQFNNFGRQRQQYRGPHYGGESYATGLSNEIASALEKLELKAGASLKEVRQQFRQLALRYHPDRPDGSSERMREILDAYNLLKKRLSVQRTYHPNRDRV